MLNNVPGWEEKLKDEWSKPYFMELIRKVVFDANHHRVFPPKEKTFRALELCDFDEVKVVIIGQDPYHGYGQANGLAFAVNEDMDIPPSLRNILKESGGTDKTLESWARQGVLLLNTHLTVREKQPMSHASYGWETFTDKIVTLLSEREKPIVFMFWGNAAQEKVVFIKSHHRMIRTPHPSPLSAHRGFIGSNCFQKCNDLLEKLGYNKIVW